MQGVSRGSQNFINIPTKVTVISWFLGDQINLVIDA